MRRQRRSDGFLGGCMDDTSSDKESSPRAVLRGPEALT